MLLLKYVMLIVGVGAFFDAAIIVAYDFYKAESYQRLLAQGTAEKLPIPKRIRWGTAQKMVALALLPILLGLSIVVVPSGMAGVRVSQISGTLRGTLYPGVHLIKPMIERVALFDMRDRVFTTIATPAPAQKVEVLSVTSQEGLGIGLAVNVRCRLDPQRLDRDVGVAAAVPDLRGDRLRGRDRKSTRLNSSH